MDKKLLGLTGLVALVLVGCGPTSSSSEPSSTSEEPSKEPLISRFAALKDEASCVTPITYSGSAMNWTYFINPAYSCLANVGSGIGKIADGKYYSYQISSSDISLKFGAVYENQSGFDADYSLEGFDVSKFFLDESTGIWGVKSAAAVSLLSEMVGADYAAYYDDAEPNLVEAYIDISAETGMIINWKTSATATEYGLVTTITPSSTGYSGLAAALAVKETPVAAKTALETLSAVSLNNTCVVTEPMWTADNGYTLYNQAEGQVVSLTGEGWGTNKGKNVGYISVPSGKTIEAGLWKFATATTPLTKELVTEVTDEESGAHVTDAWYDVTYSPYDVSLNAATLVSDSYAKAGYYYFSSTAASSLVTYLDWDANIEYISTNIGLTGLSARATFGLTSGAISTVVIELLVQMTGYLGNHLASRFTISSLGTTSSSLITDFLALVA